VLHGSRHFASSTTAQGKAVAEKIFPQLQSSLQDGSFELALQQCGFYNTTTKNWTILN